MHAAADVHVWQGRVFTARATNNMRLRLFVCTHAPALDAVGDTRQALHSTESKVGAHMHVLTLHIQWRILYFKPEKRATAESHS